MSTRPRVFVSSVIEGFEAYRQAAARAIDAAGAESVLVNEQFPSLAASSRNACLVRLRPGMPFAFPLKSVFVFGNPQLSFGMAAQEL
jgi:hypothetical protein